MKMEDYSGLQQTEFFCCLLDGRRTRGGESEHFGRRYRLMFVDTGGEKDGGSEDDADDEEYDGLDDVDNDAIAMTRAVIKPRNTRVNTHHIT